MFDPTAFIAPFVVLIALLLIGSTSIKVLREYERGVMFTLGRFSHVRGPGLILMLPYIQQMVRVDLRTVVMEVPSQTSSLGITSPSKSMRSYISMLRIRQNP